MTSAASVDPKGIGEASVFNATCPTYGKRGYFAKVCKSRLQQQNAFAACSEETTEIDSDTLANSLPCVIAPTSNLSKATVNIIIIKSITAKALLDIGSSASFIINRLIVSYKLNKSTYKLNVIMALIHMVSIYSRYFYSRTLSSCERNYTALEKEAITIAESIRKWLLYSSSQLSTDRKSVV